MNKTIAQRRIEAERGKPIRDVLCDVLASHRGEDGMIFAVCLDLGVSDATVYNWCREFGINVDAYRLPAAVSNHSNGAEDA